MKYMTNPTFDKVRELSAKFYLELPQELKDELYEALNRGIDILGSEPQMTAYIFAFGKMHQAKLNYAFDKLSDNFFEHEEINIIDYGCGQAIGTMCYADFLRKNRYSQKVKTITLIEPSEICLKRAALHTSVFFPDAEIMTVNKGFNDLNENDIICSEETPTLHILSNVLDILSFDIYNFVELIKNNLNGKNQFVCVAPYYNGNEKDNRMDLFASKINGSNIITRKYKANEFIPEKEWTCKMICFQKNMSSFEMIEDAGLEQHTIYYEADEKLHEQWIDENSISHEFANGRGVIRLKDSVTNIGDKAFYWCTRLTYITIPDSVTSIGEEAFSECSSLTSIAISKTMIRIGNQAFAGCKKLANVIIPDSVSEIGIGAFVGCKGLKEPIYNANCFAYFPCGYATEYTIPDGIKQIDDAFAGCFGLTSINIPNSVTKIGACAFVDCSGLTSINIPDSVIEIGGSAFSGCSGLTSVTIPNSVTEIGGYAFNNVRNIVYNGIAKGSPWNALSVNGFVDGHLIYSNRSKTKLIGCSTLATIVEIPESVTEISCSAFAKCCRLRSIVIPNSVKKIGESAFSECREIESIVIGNSVNEIGNYAFYHCTKLDSITIPSSVTKIGESAFSECREIESIVIGNSVNEIGNYAFHHCTKLDSITIPSSVTKIGKRAFEETGWYNKQPNGIIYLDGWCLGYKGDKTEEQLSIKEGTKGIASKAFVNIIHLRTVIFPSSLLYIGDNPFCEHSCNVISHNNSFIVENNLLLTKDKSRLIACLAKDFIVKIPKETMYIDNFAFNSSLGEEPPYFICINNEISNDFNFRYAKLIVPNANIKQNLIEKGVKNSNIIIGDVFVDEYGAFYSKDKTTLICYPAELKNKEYHILEGCKKISAGAFNYEEYADDDDFDIFGNSINVIHFPESLETIEKYGLQGCLHLKVIKYPKQKELFVKDLLQSYSDALKAHSELINIMQPE